MRLRRSTVLAIARIRDCCRRSLCCRSDDRVRAPGLDDADMRGARTLTFEITPAATERDIARAAVLCPAREAALIGGTSPPAAARLRPARPAQRFGAPPVIATCIGRRRRIGAGRQGVEDIDARRRIGAASAHRGWRRASIRIARPSRRATTIACGGSALRDHDIGGEHAAGRIVRSPISRGATGATARRSPPAHRQAARAARCVAMMECPPSCLRFWRSRHTWVKRCNSLTSLQTRGQCRHDSLRLWR